MDHNSDLNMDVDSEGSDIEVDDFDDSDNDIDVNDGLQQNQVDGRNDAWLHAIFDSDSENEAEFEGFQEEWAKDEFSVRFQPKFKLLEGATVQHPEEADALHYFELLWDELLWTKLVDETNRYADQERRKNPPPPKSPRWTPVDIPTIKAFIGLCFAMGIIRLPSRHNYWRQHKYMFVTSFNKVMSRDRFDLIWRYLHLHDNESQAAQPRPEGRPDKLRKIRWYLDYLDQRFSSNFIPQSTATIDESMIKFKGRLSF
ncbi:hypothetical protein ACJMK2_027891 [Sinanodonta woodiana]|uniref:PiggyBac transposable element-derived protein domain-containing protein n=1 Tax=Sinanodonta woodiana TaxID=1069815 RepID=A0ABD3X5C3_SINWO